MTIVELRELAESRVIETGKQIIKEHRDVLDRLGKEEEGEPQITHYVGDDCDGGHK